MKKRTYFDVFDGPGWPAPALLERYFIGPPDQRWTFSSGNDSWNLRAEGVDGTENLGAHKGRIDVLLEMYGHPQFGVLIVYSKFGGGRSQTYLSKGNLDRLSELTRDLHGDQLPVGLFIPYEAAWVAVKEFLDIDAQLPKSIEWVASRDLPPGTFPDPGAPG